MMKKILHYIGKFLLNGWVFSALMLFIFALIPTWICAYLMVELSTYVFYMYLSGALCGCIVTLRDEWEYREKYAEKCNEKLQEQEKYWKDQLEQLGKDIIKNLQDNVDK